MGSAAYYVTKVEMRASAGLVDDVKRLSEIYRPGNNPGLAAGPVAALVVDRIFIRQMGQITLLGERLAKVQRDGGRT